MTTPWHPEHFFNGLLDAVRPAYSMPEQGELPYLTRDAPAIPARFAARPEDFVVEELASFEPTGEGEHALVEIEKRGLSTEDAVARIARALDLPPSRIGFAGRKDARAVTRQRLSVPAREPARIAALDLDGLRVLAVERHARKLRLGEIAGNRFQLRLRDVEPARSRDVRSVLDVLARRGVPAWFGAQRFGRRGDGDAIGLAIARGESAEALARIAGRASERDTGAVRRARELYDAGDLAGAARAFPRRFGVEARACRALARGEPPDRVLAGVDARRLRLHLSALQSRLFNGVLSERIDELDGARAGDLVLVHADGRLVLATGSAEEAASARAFERSPTGPLFGPRMRPAGGEPAALERAVLGRFELADAATVGAGLLPGGRRALRARITELDLESGADEAGTFLELRFVLPPGAYATAVLREIGKDALREGSIR